MQPGDREYWTRVYHECQIGDLDVSLADFIQDPFGSIKTDHRGSPRQRWINRMRLTVTQIVEACLPHCSDHDNGAAKQDGIAEHTRHHDGVRHFERVRNLN